MNILVADDDDLVIDFLVRALKRDKHSVDVARDGIEALRKASDCYFDVLLLDILMPLADGVSVCNELRAQGCDTPIIFLTSISDRQTHITSLNEGADDYITKPFHYDELEARIRAIARRPRKLQPAKLLAGNGILELDLTKKTVTHNGQLLELRPKEYALLEYMIRNAGKVVPKDELLKHVWNIPASNASNRLEVCMHHIRTKINSRKHVLKTVRGYGYIIDAQ